LTAFGPEPVALGRLGRLRCGCPAPRSLLPASFACALVVGCRRSAPGPRVLPRIGGCEAAAASRDSISQPLAIVYHSLTADSPVSPRPFPSPHRQQHHSTLAAPIRSPSLFLSSGKKKKKNPQQVKNKEQSESALLRTVRAWRWQWLMSGFRAFCCCGRNRPIRPARSQAVNWPWLILILIPILFPSILVDGAVRRVRWCCCLPSSRSPRAATRHH